jgi:hypothetical protein
MRPWIAVESVPEITPRMKLIMLEMGDYAVVSRFMCTDAAVAYRATLDPVRVQDERFLQRDRLPTLENFQFATGFAEIVHSAEYAPFGPAGQLIEAPSFKPTVCKQMAWRAGRY